MTAHDTVAQHQNQPQKRCRRRHRRRHKMCNKDKWFLLTLIALSTNCIAGQALFQPVNGTNSTLSNTTNNSTESVGNNATNGTAAPTVGNGTDDTSSPTIGNFSVVNTSSPTVSEGTNITEAPTTTNITEAPTTVVNSTTNITEAPTTVENTNAATNITQAPTTPPVNTTVTAPPTATPTTAPTLSPTSSPTNATSSPTSTATNNTSNVTVLSNVSLLPNITLPPNSTLVPNSNTTVSPISPSIDRNGTTNTTSNFTLSTLFPSFFPSLAPSPQPKPPPPPPTNRPPSSPSASQSSSKYAGCIDPANPRDSGLVYRDRTTTVCFYVGPGGNWARSNFSYMRYTWRVKADRYSSYHVPNSYKSLVQAKPTNFMPNVTVFVASGATDRGISFLRHYYERKSGRIFPHLTIIIDVRKGVVRGMAWDDATIFCNPSSRAENTYQFNGTIANLREPTKGCYLTEVECDKIHQSGGTECDLKLYVVWTGEDKRGNVMSSSNSRFSAFQPRMIQNRWNDNLPELPKRSDLTDLIPDGVPGSN